MKAFLRWFQSNRVMLINSGSLVGTTAVTSGLGFVYWWMAARQFSAESVGIASAMISTMTLLGNFCILGLGTLLITELPRQPGKEGSLISTAVVVVGGVGGSIGIFFAILAPYASSQFNPLKASIGDIFIFAAGVSLTAVTLVLDQALIGVLRGSLQLWRNTFFALAKLLLLFVISLYFSKKTGMAVYATWAAGIALSLLMLFGVAVWKRGWRTSAFLPQWRLLRKLGLAALQHHLLNMILMAPTLLLPVLVTVMLSAKMDAWFYVSYMIANFIFTVPYSLTITLHAMSSAQQAALRKRARVTIALSLLTGVLANCVLQLAAKQVLGLFGRAYADQAAWCLHILALVVFPMIITTHYVAFCRIQDRIAGAARSLVFCGILELGGAALGAHLGELAGLSLGLLLATTTEAIFMFPTVYRTVLPVKGALPMSDVQEDYETVYEEAEAVWRLDTLISPTLPLTYSVGMQTVAYQRLLEDLDTRKIGAVQVNKMNSYHTKSRLKPTRLEKVSNSQRERNYSGTPSDG